MSDKRAADWWDKLGTHDLIIKHPIQPKKKQLLIEESSRYQEEQKIEHIM